MDAIADATLLQPIREVVVWSWLLINHVRVKSVANVLFVITKESYLCRDCQIKNVYSCTDNWLWVSTRYLLAASYPATDKRESINHVPY